MVDRYVRPAARMGALLGLQTGPSYSGPCTLYGLLGTIISWLIVLPVIDLVMTQ
jgi:hypothetical protein